MPCFQGRRPEDGTDPKNINMTEMLVDLKPNRPGARHDQGKTGPRDGRQAQRHAGHRADLQPAGARPDLESISQIDGQIVIKLFGDDMETLRAEGRQVLERIGKVPGVVRAFIDRDGDLPQYRLEIDRAAAARYGLNVMDVQDVVETALAGKAATELGKATAISASSSAWPSPRQLDKLKEVLVPTPPALQVPLSALVDFRWAAAP